MGQDTEPTDDGALSNNGRWLVPLAAAAATLVLIAAVTLLLSNRGGQGEPSAGSPSFPITTPSSRTSDGSADESVTDTAPTAATSTGSGAPSTPETTVDVVLAAAAAGDRGNLPDPGVIGDREWDQLVGYVDGQGGAAAGCRDNGGGTWDCELRLEADPSRVYYAILAPGQDGHGWRITYLGMADG